ncbi:putative germin-like protein 2-1 [Telopea speciosissima]|uniref:putative germin-like protein 2-1 n=1 Tax=Telopea speciosissima TaxID=54955 RepID=UPI001CC443CF|nr:putative germin-like protein 2-1 [Telopea speciosissima]
MINRKMDFHCLVAFVIFAALASTLSCAYDPSPLQDICVAIKNPNSAVLVNGKFCKDSKLATADDFLFTGLNIPGNTSNAVGSKVTPVFVDQLPGLNTLGVALSRIDFAPYGLNPPHTHPRATEILTVLEGSLYVGFVTSDPDYRLVSKVLNKGDVFVFPIGLFHFQQNVGHTSAVAISGFSSQNPGLIVVGNAVFGSKPPISDDALAKAFQVDKKVIDEIQAKFAMAK